VLQIFDFITDVITKQQTKTNRMINRYKGDHMKITKVLSLIALMFVPVLASAQWVHDDTFQAHKDSIRDVHGVAVDPDGKVWVQSYYASEAVIMNRDIGADGVADTLLARAIYVYNADGTQASFSPLKFIDYGDGKVDTLGYVWYADESDTVDGGAYEGYSGRGITADAAGNIIISAFNRLYKVDYTDGSGIAMVDPSAGCSLTEATTDDANNVYVGCVVGSAGPLVKFAPDLTGEEALVTIPGSYSRDLQVSGDGNTIWWAGYTNGSVHRFSRDDEFSSFGDADTVLVGIKSEVFDIHPVTGHVWVGSGSLNDVPASPWTPQTWYAFDASTIGTENEIPVDSIHWDPTVEDGAQFDAARPRGLDFSPDGMIAYISVFASSDGMQKHMKSEGNSNELVNRLPDGYTLDQNYPNPFNPSTNINYSLQEAGHVTLKVYDMTGREIATLVNGRVNAGAHTVTFNASNLSSGVYIYALEANGVRLTNRMTLIK
jgi:hypothetical protein